jgi:hypothetical protein
MQPGNPRAAAECVKEGIEVTRVMVPSLRCYGIEMVKRHGQGAEEVSPIAHSNTAA